MMSPSRILTKVLAVGVLVALVSACSGLNPQKPPDPRTVNPTDVRKQGSGGKIFGDDFLVFGGPEKREEDAGGGGLGVNSYLWRASLDTLTFLPVNSADPFGGVIITDWYSPPEAAGDERFKLNVYILGRALRADGVKVAVFRQVASAGAWSDAPVEQGVGMKIEDAILMRARQLRYETQNQ